MTVAKWVEHIQDIGLVPVSERHNDGNAAVVYVMVGVMTIAAAQSANRHNHDTSSPGIAASIQEYSTCSPANVV